MSYKWKNGARVPAAIDADKVGERFQRIAERNGGHLTPPAVLKDALKKSSPMHDYFEWDDTEAAEKWRIEQAGYLIRNIVVPVILEEGDDGEPADFRPYVSVVIEEEGPVYMDVQDVMNDPALQEQAIAGAMRELRHWRRKHAQLKALAFLFETIDNFTFESIAV